ncbi:MAG: exosome complex RNA-binding protein Rrp4 [Candidatus Bathyarchaeota archaeon]|nr:exosome complex RNA-binding protein Rrp4 [Candidatus Bathyarchaeota archaeon]
MPTFYENRQLVAPGDLVAEGNYVAGENTYKENERVYSTHVGLVQYNERLVSVVALKAFYTPKVGDTVIGKVTDLMMVGWILDIDAPYSALLRASDVIERSYRPQKDDLSSIFNVGDLIIAKIVSTDRTRDPLLTVREPGLGKISRGQIVRITPSKIPRIIGRKGSMISIIKRETGCQILLGQNGMTLIIGKNPRDIQLAATAVRKIENESHTSGLTDRVTEMLQKEKKERGEENA